MANPEWAGAVNVIANNYLKEAEDETKRKRLLLALLDQDGRIEYNCKGFNLIWDVQYARTPMETYGDAQTLTFQRHDLYRQLSLDWRGYKMTDMYTRKETLMCRGDLQLVKGRYTNRIKQLTDQMRQNFNGELFVDGNASGNTSRIHGLESFMGSSTTAAGDRLAKPSDTYAGKSTALGAEGGGWSATLTTKPNANVATDFPDGTDSGLGEYDYFSPKLVNYSSTGWNTNSATTFADNGEKAMRQASIWMTYAGGDESKPSICLLARDLYYPFADSWSSKQRLDVYNKRATDLGFGHTLNFEGMAVQMDFDCPVSVGYMLTTGMMELCSMEEQLFHAEGPDYSIENDSYLMHIGFFGNAKYRPKHFGKLAAYA